MWGTVVLANVIFGAVTMAAAETTKGTGVSDEATLRSEFETLSKRRIFFGHQSVGMNLLEGVKRLAAQQGAALRVTEASVGASVPAGTLVHAFVAENGNPARKLESFASVLSALPAPGVDIALIKFCWIDFQPETDSRALFARYQETIAGLKAKYPGTIFVHVTAPLTTVQAGPKALLKRLLGRTPYGLAENARREEYNSHLRNAYRSREPFFDLAEIESSRPDGLRETTDWNGRAIPALAAAYTDDGGHLNDAGQLKAGRALLELLASVAIGGRSTTGSGESP